MLFPRVSLLVYATLAISATFASPLPYLPNYAVAEHHDSLDEPSEVEISRSNNRVARWLHGLSIVPRSSDDDPSWHDEEYVDVSPRSIAGRTVLGGVGAKFEANDSDGGSVSSNISNVLSSALLGNVTSNVNITLSDCITCIKINLGGDDHDTSGDDYTPEDIAACVQNCLDTAGPTASSCRTACTPRN